MEDAEEKDDGEWKSRGQSANPGLPRKWLLKQSVCIFVLELSRRDGCFVAVALYKRAQILVADIWACCRGAGYGAFSDIDAITAFADYRIPQVFVWLDVLQYSNALMHTLHNSKHRFL